MSNTASESSPVGASIDQLAQEGSVRLLETIQKKCLFLRIRVHGFDGRRTIKDAQVEIDGEAIDKDLTSPPSCVLVPKEWRMRLGKIGRKVREAAQNVSIRNRVAIRCVIPVHDCSGAGIGNRSDAIPFRCPSRA